MKIDFKKFKLKEKIVLLNAVILTVIAVILIFLIFPSVTLIRKIQINIQSQLIELENKYNKAQALRQTSSNLKKVEPLVGLLDRGYIKQEKEIEFITNLEELAVKNRITQKLNLGSIKINKTPQKVTLQIFTKGKFEDQVRYLKGLEKLNYYSNVKNVEIIKDTAKKDGDTKMVLLVDTYWQ
ncbi:MAG: hypothetical protein UT48_C0004G0015 [Parcubacteria group bacterium GW2011_GWE2_39_37]|uniref:Uncharacterized protein n=1 Tax=Candidatus Falkowbacteria bacterium GW2011_GWF2_39_8 TaxID=1618642 RepID=A0A0G0PSP8_9BACT|nr:MAG: hypothetical protein UT48_C0004G0015 [Parcubacteria group bacterium GW2011_GWE2_39_37]KKR31184.1 MAG: hypothetical protein UT64_C0070G0012 [Candidatus Falkowbacteria bacterium GW2011_GWF2_39_8]